MVLHLNDLDKDEEVIEDTTRCYPDHFMVRIESFSLLTENGIDKYESTEFKRGDYKWRLIIYPNGKECDPSSDHVSVYLSVADPSSLSMSSEINVSFDILLHNHRTDYFFSKGGKARFSTLSPAAGFSKFILKETFTDTSGGYLVDDMCEFGVEVFYLPRPNIIERLVLIKAAEPIVRSWSIPNYSQLKDEWRSENFIVAEKRWYVRLYLEGSSNSDGNNISIFLNLIETEQKVKAKYTIRIKDQIGNGHRVRSSSGSWFGRSGWSNFMRIADMNNPERVFVVNDCCLLEVEITVLANVSTSS